MLSVENVKYLNDNELRAELIKRGFTNVGPMGPTTRPLWEKRLVKNLKESIIPGRPDKFASPKQETITKTVQVVQPSFPKSTIQTQTVHSLSPRSTIQTQTELMEVNNIYNSVPVQTNIIEKPEIIEESNFPSLEFKLIKSNQDQNFIEPNINHNNNYNTNIITHNDKQILNNFDLKYPKYKTNNFGYGINTDFNDNSQDHSFLKRNNFDNVKNYKNYSVFNNYHDQYNDSYIGYANQNNNENAATNRKKNLLKLSPDVLLNKNDNYRSNYFSEESIYNQTAPPQPKNIRQINTRIDQFQNYISNFFPSFCKFILGLILALIILNFMLPNNNENPIDA